MIISQHFDDFFLADLLQYLKRSILCTVSLHQSRLMPFVIGGLSWAHCTSLKLL